ncbi:hypothetical protein RABR111495_14940 [Rahnella bruchi]|uniref:bestrophin-like domain n=1 Tax=Rahnella bruchi TaxID=1510573 RepID=UPI000EA224CA|nr:hypothetical protein [Rahnella bruchi]
MQPLLSHPAFFFVACFALMSLGGCGSIFLLRRQKKLDNDVLEDFGIVQAATLTLLALLIGFSFSMAVSRYDQRKNYEEEEANAIGTEFLRADLAQEGNAGNIRQLLKDYLDQRLAFYQTSAPKELEKISARTGELETKLWQSVLTEAKSNPTPVVALLVSGMNDVINTQGYTQAAWWNRIPTSAWALMMVISLFSSMLVGYGARSNSAKSAYLFIFPLMISLSMALIADIDSPRGGLIRVAPQNLISLHNSLGP